MSQEDRKVKTVKKVVTVYAWTLLVACAAVAQFCLPVHAQSDCPPLYTLVGSDYAELGCSVSGAIDFNGDGYDDFMAGAPGAQSAFIYSGLDGTLLCELQGEGGNDYFGVRVSGAGDINNDGFGDVIVGAHRNAAAGADAGRAYVFLGGPGPYPRTINAANADMILTGEAASDLFGVGVDGIGDVNDDGFGDVVVGAYESSAGAYKAGRVYVFLGSPGPYPQNISADSAYYILTGDDAEARFGASVAGVGDIDLDGYDDFIIGEEGDDAGGTNAGAAHVISGQTGNLLYKFNGEFPNDRHGIGVSGAGDVNGDGWPDVVVGSDLYGGWTGKAYVYSGQDGTLLIDITGEAGGDRFGHFVSNAGDMNGDGFDDVLLSAYINDAGGHYAGRAYVVFGGNGPYPVSMNASEVDFIFTGEAANDRFGWSIACAGNLNNDCTDEIIIGAVDEDHVGSNVYVFDCITYVIDPCTFSDDFEDGFIDPCRWETGCATRGWDSSQSQGEGDWTCSVDEIVDADGFIQMEVQGPTSGNTYGAEAWALASANLNDGNCHVIDFTWEVEVDAPGHYNYHYIQITDGFIPELGSVHWPQTQPPIEGTVNLAVHEDPLGQIVQGIQLVDGLAKTTWSVVVQASGKAMLYDGPGGTGNFLHQAPLDPAYPWHLRFMVIDATSSGFPAGHDKMKIYDIVTECGGCCIAHVGDANGLGGDEPTIGDVSVMIDAKFITGDCVGSDPQNPILPCLAEANINQSGSCDPTCDDITIGDISILIDYLFITGSSLGLPECGDCAQGNPSPLAKGSADVSLLSSYEDGYTTITVSSAVMLRGLQLQVQGSGTTDPINLTDNRLDLFHGVTDDVIRIGMIDMNGLESISVGNTPVIRLEGEYEIISALVTDQNHQDIVPTINGARKNEALPMVYALAQNYPNPFNPATEISYSIKQAGDVRIDVFNMLGQKVATLFEGYSEAGHHAVNWDASDQASGVYLYRLTAGEFVDTKKMMLLK